MANLNVAVVISGQDAGASSVMTQITSAASGLAEMVKGSVAVAVGTLLPQMFESAASAMANFVAEAAQVESQQASLVALLNSTNQAARLNQSAVNALAMQYRDLYGGEAQAVVGIEMIGLRSGEISSAQMPQFIRTVADLGAVLGNTTTAATLLARAQDDPVGAFTRLERVTGVYDLALKENIATMVKHGDTAGAVAAIMNYVAQTTGGTAAAAADTLSGKWSILVGHAGDLANVLTGPLVAALENLLGMASPTLDAFEAKFESTFLPLITNAAAWGQAIVEVLAEGMQSAFGLVVDVITQLGNIIGGLLAPGSPPKFLPQLDKWGEQAVNVYMGGWANFDTSVFDVLYKAIKGGLPSAEIQEYADATSALTTAQDQLNAVTQHYDDILNPLNAQLAAVQLQQEKLSDAKRIAKDQEILGDFGYSADDKAAAALDIQAIQLKEKIDQTNLEKKTAVDAAKEKVDADQKVVDSLKANIDLQLQFTNQTNAGAAAASKLSGEVKGLGGALAGLKDQFGGTSGAVDGMKGKIDSAMDQMKANIDRKANEIRIGIQQQFGAAQEYIAGLFAPGGIFAPITPAYDSLKGVVSNPAIQAAIKNTFQWLLDNKELVIGGLVGITVGIGIMAASLYGLTAAGAVFAGLAGVIAPVFSPVVILTGLFLALAAAVGVLFAYLIQHTGWNTIVNNTQLAVATIKGVLEGWTAGTITQISDMLNTISTNWETWITGRETDWETWLNTTTTDAETALATMTADIQTWLADRGKDLTDFITTITTDWDNFWAGLSGTVKSTVDTITGFINNLIDSIKTAISWIEKLAGMGGPGAAASAAAGHASGLDMIVPSGFDHDSFPLASLGWAQSGERITITPAGQAASSTTNMGSITINIYGATNPTMVADAVARKMKEYGYRAEQLTRMGIR